MSQLRLKETEEFLTALVNTSAQGIESFADGAQVSDVPDFFDEALSWEKAITGFAAGFPAEARTATGSSSWLYPPYLLQFETTLTSCGLFKRNK